MVRLCSNLYLPDLFIGPGHAVTGAKIFREMFYLKYESEFQPDFYAREEIAYLIRYQLLYLLAKADIIGRECEDQEGMIATVEYFKEYSLELGCFHKKIMFANEYTRYRYLQGGNVLYKVSA